MVDVTLVVAFVAGLVSLLSPCVLPLIPGFIAYLAASTTGKNVEPTRRQLFAASFFFVLGFSVVFASLGVLLNSALENISYDLQIWLSRLGGIVIMFFGFYLLCILPINFLAREHKIHVTKKFGSSYLTSFVFGAAFAVGWTPCVGAALGAILALAATQPSAAFTLLITYAAGLGLPFLVVGLFADQATRWLNRLGSLLKWINIVLGIILTIIGMLVFTQGLSFVANFGSLGNFLLEV